MKTNRETKWLMDGFRLQGAEATGRQTGLGYRDPISERIEMTENDRDPQTSQG